MELKRDRKRSETPKGQATKDSILNAAEKIFAKKGFIRAGVDEVIRALGISAGALYHHFPSKRSLLEGIGERAVNKLTTSMNAWIADDQLSPGAKVDRFLDAMDDGRRLRVMVDYLGLGIVREDRDMHEVVVQLGLEPLTDRLVKFIEQGNACKEFRVSNPKATALIVMLLISESIHRVGRIEQIVPDGKFNASLREAINRLLMRGIT